MAKFDESKELEKDKEYLDNTNNEQTKVILELQAQIEQLKGQVELLSEKVGFWEEQTKLKEEQIEEYDRLTIFDIARTDELQEQIEKMKCCGNCKNKKGWKGEKPCLDCKYNLFGEGKEDKWEFKE